MLVQNKFAIEHGLNSTWRASHNVNRIAKAYRRKGTFPFYNICLAYDTHLLSIDQRNRAHAEYRQRHPYTPYKPANPYDSIETTTPLMGPPPGPESDIASMTDTCSVVESTTDCQSFRSRSRSQSKQPSRSQSLSQAQRLKQQLEQEVAALREQKEIQELQKERAELMAALGK
jgi:hypothetical protein